MNRLDPDAHGGRGFILVLVPKRIVRLPGGLENSLYKLIGLLVQGGGIAGDFDPGSRALYDS